MIFGLLLPMAVSMHMPDDAAYLNAVASVHEFCAADFEALCGDAPRRHLTEVVVEVFVAQDTDDNLDHVHSRVPLMLGPNGDKCLRRGLPEVSEACYASVARVDVVGQDQAPPPPFCGHPVFLLAVGLLVTVVCVKAIKKRSKMRAIKQIVRTLHANQDLKARVEAAAGVKVPKPPAKGCCRCFLAALVALFAGYAVTLLLGPALTLIVIGLVLLAAVFNNAKCSSNKAPRPSSTTADVGEYEPPVVPKLLV